MAVQAALQFKSYEISRVVFDKPIGFFSGEFSINFQHINHVDTQNKNNFKAEFIVTVSSNDNLFNLQVQTIGHFEINEDVPDVTYNNYLAISAPTIIYPYIRAFITNLVIQSGMQPIIIPPINFGAKLEAEQSNSVHSSSN